MPTIARLFAVTIDCPDPIRLARFYQEFLGGHLRSSNPDFVVLTSNDNVRLDFQRVTNHQPHQWPDPAAPRRLHLDFSVEDLHQAEQHLLALGATLATHQPGGRHFRVLLDPAGHPFCLASTTTAGTPTQEPALDNGR
ncbi:VOC family protein [Nocardia sp. XZ_19_385]|uniref:VOC family protein n=1 Tax=Nocardia sp. XZ_19_385 TaxID=2769488 RepID=UPI0018901082|nr:VOC family protein [Nocardia sp. XZ_19_385]